MAALLENGWRENTHCNLYVYGPDIMSYFSEPLDRFLASIMKSWGIMVKK